MRKFWKDYFDVCKEGCKFMRNHWLGYIIVCVVATILTFGCLVINWTELFQKMGERIKSIWRSVFKKDEETKEEA